MCGKMAKRENSSRAKKMEALERSQQINEALETSTIESAALLSSAGESRPTLESHVLDLLDKPQAEIERETPKRSESKSRAKRKRKK